MEVNLELIYTKLIELDEEIQSIKKDIDIIKTQTNKMDQHVNFVNNVYEHVEEPLNYVVGKWKNLFGSSTITHNEDQVKYISDI